MKNDPAEAEAIRKLLEMNGTMRSLREHIVEGGNLAKEYGAGGLAVAAYMLAEALGVYSSELTKFVASDLLESK